MNSTTIYINGVQYFLDSSSSTKKIFQFDGLKWNFICEVPLQSVPPGTLSWWLDSSSNPPKLKYYDGMNWKTINTYN